MEAISIAFSLFKTIAEFTLVAVSCGTRAGCAGGAQYLAD